MMKENIIKEKNMFFVLIKQSLKYLIFKKDLVILFINLIIIFKTGIEQQNKEGRIR